MPGRHEAEDTSAFWRGLAFLILKVVAGIVAFVAVAFVIVEVLPSVFPSDDEPPVSIVDGVDTTTTTLEEAAVPIRTTSTTSGGDSTSSTVAETTGSSSTTSTTTSTTTTSTTSTSTTTTTLAGPLPPTEVTVRVLNSTTRSGIAAALTADLAALGYQMIEQDNYRPTLADTFVYYAEGFEEEAAVVAQNVEGGIVAENPAPDPSANVLIILGTNYPG